MNWCSVINQGCEELILSPWYIQYIHVVWHEACIPGEVPSLGGFLSRCSIFRQGESSCVQSCMCVCVFMWLFGCPSFGGFLSRCSIFRQGESSCARSCMCVCSCGSLAVKMFHLSAASCQDAPSLGRESHPVFGHVCVCVFMWLFGCQDVPSFGGFLSRCSIFRQGESSCVQSCMCVCVHVALWLSRCSIFRRLPVKMLHL